MLSGCSSMLRRRRRPLFDWLKGRTQPTPVTFQMTLPWISDQQLGFRRGTIAMYTKDWSPIANAGP